MGGGSCVETASWEAEATGSLASGISRSLSELLEENEGSGRAGADLRRTGADMEAEGLDFDAGPGALKAGGARFLGMVGLGGIALRPGDVERWIRK